MINIALIDDHRIVRDGIKLYLSDAEGINVIGEASDGIQGFLLLEKEVVDIVLLDVNMKNMDGITTMKKIAESKIDTKVIALSMLNDSQTVKQMIEAGVHGYILKNCSRNELIKAIQTVYEGDNYYTPEITQIVIQSLKQKKSSQATEIDITQREMEILRLILEEKTNKEIAEELFISPRTVDAHKRNLLEKTQSKNVAGLVLFAIRNGIFQDLF
ncbi:response regulator [Sediminitomix flava]|uniref:LuxR family two component transcriptional regulator n=1 Tax=Sediminitomix flava TaxID=379075 RepID=A0A315ZB34_SEDFL|nr:response regulator transcription factor [Sediminitomix flava]PWJ42502.1 LuxR family two component transcriptional regulator [Sediminitomix flava]